MINCKNCISAVAALALFPVAGMCAYESDVAESDLMETPTSSGTSSLTLKATYFSALEDIDSALGSVDLAGLTFDYTKRFGDASGVVNPEFVLSLGFGYGEEEWSGWYYDLEGSLFSINAALGFNLRFNCGDAVSLWLGPRVGLNVMYVELEARYYGDYGSDDDCDIGLLYGAEGGIDINFTPHHALTFGIAWLASTAQPYDIEEQSYLQFSAGYKFTF